jgi:hypothetical protein
VSELVTDLDWWAATRYPNVDDNWGPAEGRHAYNEEAALTPIFHALTRGGRRTRQQEPTHLRPVADPMDEFRRNPLTAPIPVQAPAGRRRRREQSESGRHHRIRETRHNW